MEPAGARETLQDEKGHVFLFLSQVPSPLLFTTTETQVMAAAEGQRRWEGASREEHPQIRMESELTVLWASLQALLAQAQLLERVIINSLTQTLPPAPVLSANIY